MHLKDYDIWLSQRRFLRNSRYLITFNETAGPKSPVKKMNVWEVEENKFNTRINWSNEKSLEEMCLYWNCFFIFFFGLNAELTFAFHAVWLQSQIERKSETLEDAPVRAPEYQELCPWIEIVSASKAFKIWKQDVFKLLNRLKQWFNLENLKANFRKEIFRAQGKFYFTSV